MVTNRPTQPVAYHRGAYPLTKYAKPGAIAITIGRDEDQKEDFKAIARAGGTVLTYIDPVIDNPYGRYHELLHLDSEFGPRTELWLTPDNKGYQANSWGKLVDIRPGSTVQRKFEHVLRRIVAECPHIGGFFLDDVGTRSWFAGVPWGSWPDDYRQGYRDGAIELVKTARRVADEYGLIVIANGTWGAGDLRSQGGGYPDTRKHGCSLLDGAMVENHPASEIAYWRDYCLSPQWATESPITQGTVFMLSTNRTKADRDAFVSAGIVSHAEAQEDYQTATAPWGEFHPTGLPSGVSEADGMFLTDLEDAVRSSGLITIPEPGWRERSVNRNGMLGVKGIIVHHTAGGGPNDWKLVRDGRSGLSGPLAHLTLERDGYVRVIAAGKANHAGAGSHPAIGVNNGNDWTIGIEGVSSGVGSNAWTQAQREAYPRLCAALCVRYRIPVSLVLGHKEWAPGRKIDPGEWDMDDFRRDVAEEIGRLSGMAADFNTVREDLFGNHNTYGHALNWNEKRIVEIRDIVDVLNKKYRSRVWDNGKQSEFTADLATYILLIDAAAWRTERAIARLEGKLDSLRQDLFKDPK